MLVSTVDDVLFCFFQFLCNFRHKFNLDCFQLCRKYGTGVVPVGRYSGHNSASSCCFDFLCPLNSEVIFSGTGR